MNIFKLEMQSRKRELNSLLEKWGRWIQYVLIMNVQTKCDDTRWNDGKVWAPAHVDQRGYHQPFEPGRCPMVTKTHGR